MAGRDKKEQLGARVTPGVRQRCVSAAQSVGLSLNAWVERALLRALEGQPAAPAPVITDGQLSVDDYPELFAEGAVPGGPAPSAKTFASDCSMSVYHWRCGPGNPCRRCGGETA